MFREPRGKKNVKIKKSQPLPLFQKSNNELIRFKGKFNGYCVKIEKTEEMEKLYYNGYFGKANLSRAFPCFSKNTENAPIIRKRQFQQRKEWKEKYSENSKVMKVIVVPDSDSDVEADDYFINLKPTYQIDGDLVKEKLHVNFEEAMFLSSALKCLDIYIDERLLNTNDVWALFTENNPYFIQNYVVYYYFRSKNWVVKSGIKFGGDFLLYKDGPPFYHASYLVIIDVINNLNLNRNERLCRRSMDTTNIIGLNRLCETAGKELLIAQIIWPDNFEVKSSEDISELTIKVILANRYLLTEEKDQNEETID